MSMESRTRVDGPATPVGEDDETEENGAVPHRIGRFYIFHRLGEGGMGEVFLGWDERLDRKLAIKLLRRRGDEDVRRRMLREAQALARLSHPNVIHVYEVGEFADQLYLAMEYAPGLTLRGWVKARTRPTALIVERYIQAGRGLAAAHEAGLLHRDFKPDNAIVGDDGRVRVLDFGLARAEGAAASLELEESLRFKPSIRVSGSGGVLDAPMTVAGTVLGTPAYMPVEQLSGDATDGRSDQFSFCVALWEALYGVRPFRGETLKELTHAIARGHPDEGSGGRAIPRRLRAALVRGLAAYPSERWPTMAELLRAIEGSTRRRRWKVAAISGALALSALPVALAARGWQEERALAACEARGAAITAIWNDAVKADVRASALATGLDYATSSVNRLAPILDAYAGAWASTASAVCREVELDGEWPPELAAEADACLQEMAWSLEALVSESTRADPGQLERAVLAALGLPRVERCLDASWLARRPRPPDDPASQAEIAAIGQELERVRSLEAFGRIDEATPIARALVDRADGLGWRPLVARARFIAGRLAEERAIDEAAALLQEGFFIALDAGEDRLAAEIASRLVVAVGVDLDRPQEGALWGAWAAALIRREPTGRDLLEGRLDAQLGLLAQSQDDGDGAERHWRRALTTWELALGPQHPEVASMLNNIGAIESDRGDLDEARALWERALAIWEASLGPEHAKTAAVLVNLGLIYEDQGDHARALASTRRALAIWEQSLGSDHAKLVDALLNIGRAERARGDLAAAFDAYGRAVAICERTYGPGHIATAYALHALADVALERGDAAAAAASAEVAAAIFVAEEDNHAGRSLALLARAQLAAGDEARARATYAEALGALSDPALREDDEERDDADRDLAVLVVAFTDARIAEGEASAQVRLLRRALSGRLHGQGGLLGDAEFALARALAASGAPIDEVQRVLLQASLDYAELGRLRGGERVAATVAWREAAGIPAGAGAPEAGPAPEAGAAPEAGPVEADP